MKDLLHNCSSLKFVTIKKFKKIDFMICIQKVMLNCRYRFLNENEQDTITIMHAYNEIEIDLYSRVLPCPVHKFCCPIGDS